jgi:hypothetical protein
MLSLNIIGHNSEKEKKKKSHVHKWVVLVAIVIKHISILLIHTIDIHPDRYIELFHWLFDQVELFHYEQLMVVIHKFFLTKIKIFRSNFRSCVSLL